MYSENQTVLKDIIVALYVKHFRRNSFADKNCIGDFQCL